MEKPQEASSSKKQKQSCYIYGNFHHYYGYRNQGCVDNRLSLLKKEWITGKDVLDVGCNAGHFTLSVARDYSPKLIIGLDIDNALIRIAKKNVKHYLTEEVEYDSVFPISCVSNYGPLAQALLKDKGYESVKFPFNVSFIQGNYVLDYDEELELQKPQFDTIFFLSLTKWIHLNWGDEGIKRCFHRIYAQLKPGGHMVLEAQPTSSYRKKKKISEVAYANFTQMQFFPEQFNGYLTKTVGFKSCELIAVPDHCKKGFKRPLYLFTKEESMEKGEDLPSSSDDDTSELSDFTHSEVEELSD